MKGNTVQNRQDNETAFKPALIVVLIRTALYMSDTAMTVGKLNIR